MTSQNLPAGTSAVSVPANTILSPPNSQAGVGGNEHWQCTRCSETARNDSEFYLIKIVLELECEDQSPYISLFGQLASRRDQLLR